MSQWMDQLTVALYHLQYGVSVLALRHKGRTNTEALSSISGVGPQARAPSHPSSVFPDPIRLDNVVDLEVAESSLKIGKSPQHHHYASLMYSSADKSTKA